MSVIKIRHQILLITLYHESLQYCCLFPGLMLILRIADDGGNKQTGQAVTDITDFLRVSFHFDYRKAFAARE